MEKKPIRIRHFKDYGIRDRAITNEQIKQAVKMDVAQLDQPLSLDFLHEKSLCDLHCNTCLIKDKVRVLKGGICSRGIDSVAFKHMTIGNPLSPDALVKLFLKEKESFSLTQRDLFKCRSL